MSSNQQLVDAAAFVAGADLSAKQGYIVVKNGTGRQVVLAAANTDRVLGILQNAPASGQPASVITFGTAFAIAGAAIAVGAELSTNAGGQVITLVPGAGVYSIGIALEAATAINQRILILVQPMCVVS